MPNTSASTLPLPVEPHSPVNNNKVDHDPRMINTLKLLSKAPKGLLTLPKAMRAEGYSQAESRSTALQMRIRRRLAGGGNGVGGGGGGKNYCSSYNWQVNWPTDAEHNSNNILACDNTNTNTTTNAAESPHDLRVQRTVKLLQRTTGLTVPKAMRAEGFVVEDCMDCAKQMWIQRRLLVDSSVGKTKKEEEELMQEEKEGCCSSGSKEEGLDDKEEEKVEQEEEGEEDSYYSNEADDGYNEERPQGNYYAVKVGYYATTPTAGACARRADRQQQYGITIRSAIFLHWEDARQFLVSKDTKMKKGGVEYEAFDTLEGAEEYLIEEQESDDDDDEYDDDREEEEVAAIMNMAGTKMDVTVVEVDVDDSNNHQCKPSMAAASLPSSKMGLTSSQEKKKKKNYHGYYDTVKAAAAAAAVGQGKQTPASSNLTRDHQQHETTTTRPIKKKSSVVNDKEVEELPSTKEGAKRKRVALTPWDKMYNKLVEYKRANNGSIEIPDIDNHDDNDDETYSSNTNPPIPLKELKSLRRWCNTQTQQLRRWSQGHTTMDTGIGAHYYSGQADAKKQMSDRMDKLQTIGFPIPPSYDEMYAKLSEHKERTGVLLDVNKDDDEELYTWMMEQKRMLAHHFHKRHDLVPLTQQQIQNLMKLGFAHGRINNNGTMGVIDTGLEERKWDGMLDALVRYKEKHGSFVFPHRSESTKLTKEERSLKIWYKKQRREYKLLLLQNNNQPSTTTSLTARRLQRLTSIPGLDLTPHTEIIPWEERLQSLREFVAENGHCMPKRTHPTLGDFVSNMRTFYRQRQEGKVNCLTEERVNDLLELGFVFQVAKSRNYTHAPYRSWEDRFQDLLAFKEEHGHTFVTMQYGPLGRWVRDQ